MPLSSLIVQREIATIRQVEEALARQVLYGGDLVTNLLEVAPIEEWRVAVTCADSVGLSAAPPGKLALPPPKCLRSFQATQRSRAASCRFRETRSISSWQRPSRSGPSSSKP